MESYIVQEEFMRGIAQRVKGADAEIDQVGAYPGMGAH